MLSQCLELEACRYDGHRIRDSFVARLLEHVDVIPVCPEVEIGLGTPRATIRLVNQEGTTRLMQPSSQEDLTERMVQFTRRFLDGLKGVDGFVLKSGSPSCGTGDVKVYSKMERSPMVRRESGLFARAVLDQFDELAIEDEGRLRNFDIRHHFLSSLFALADLRLFLESPTKARLVDFHRRHKHLLFLYDEPGMRELGRIVANNDGRPFDEVLEKYGERFRKSLKRQPRRRAHLNVLMHIYGHFKTYLTDGERHEFLQLLDEVSEHHLSLNAPLSVIRTWCARFEYAYMADQSYLHPYPRQLIMMRDSGKGFDF